MGGKLLRQVRSRCESGGGGELPGLLVSHWFQAPQVSGGSLAPGGMFLIFQKW